MKPINISNTMIPVIPAATAMKYITTPKNVCPSWSEAPDGLSPLAIKENTMLRITKSTPAIIWHTILDIQNYFRCLPEIIIKNDRNPQIT